MRTDIHRPSAIVPADYCFVACVYVGGSGGCDPFEVLANAMAWQQVREHIAKTGGKYSNHEHGGNCHVCGAMCSYQAVFYHPSTNTYIKVGEDCAAKMDMDYSGEAFRALRKGVNDFREAKAGRTKAQLILADIGVPQVWDWFVANQKSDMGLLVSVGAVTDHGEASVTRFTMTSDFRLLTDMVKSLIRLGHLSEKQEEFIKTLADRIVNAKRISAERAAKEAAEREAAEDCPVGRLEICGEVVSTKVEEGQYGTNWKMLVRDDRGFKVWGSIPASLQYFDCRPEDGDIELPRQRILYRGDRVQFVATVEQSSKDQKFGFFKRPSKAKCLTLTDKEVIRVGAERERRAARREDY